MAPHAQTSRSWLLENAGYLDPASRIRRADLLVVDGVIAALGPPGQTGERETVERLDCTGMIVLPGLVNGHFHSQSNAGRGLFRSMGLHDWGSPGTQGELQQRFFEFLDAGATEDDMRVICMRAFAELLLQGVTFTQDSGLAERPVSALVQAANAVGIRVFVDAYAEVEQLAGSEQGLAHFGGHLPEEEDITDETLAVARQARSSNATIFMTHCLETTVRRDLVLERYNRSTVELFDEHGLLDERTVLFHGVELGDEDIQTLAQRGVSLAHCPVSNLSAVAPIGQCLEQGVNVCIGTDFGYADMWEAMRVAFYLQKGRAGTPLVDAETIWRMATANGAKAYGLGDRLGTIAEGYSADLVLVDASDVALLPLVDGPDFTNVVHNLLVFGRPSMVVRHVLVAGEMVVRDRHLTTIDEADLDRRYREIARRVAEL